ncbi:MAG TPA: adenylate/guanylate cyclase domain-containing protein [Abditibacteriaceae bacterium]|jgi:class 3 adenylate cyclase
MANESASQLKTQPAFSLETFQLFDLAEAVAAEEADEWGEDPGLNLFLEDSIELIQNELTSMPVVSAVRSAGLMERRTKSASSVAESTPQLLLNARGRVFVMIGALSVAARQIEHFKAVAHHADVWIFGAPDVVFPQVEGVIPVPLTAGTALARERSVVVDSPLFGAVLLATEAGRLDEDDPTSRYFEGFLTARQSAVIAASERLCGLLQLAPLASRSPDRDLTVAWQSRMNLRLLEQLEGQKLALRARTLELQNLVVERERVETMLRSYIGGRTWDEVQSAIEEGRSTVATRRVELTICFCDLVGFTTLSERLHPTEVATFLNDHFAKLHDIVRAHGGWVDKFIGDAMLAVFDNPTEAMIASQKMVRESRKVRVNELMEQAVQVRVGLNTGIVAEANLGTPERRERTVLGDAVNTAQRLQSAAWPHSILLSARTFSRLPFAISRQLEPLDLQVKGKKDPLVAYRWTIHGERRIPDERIVLRESLINASRRTPLFERLRKADNPDAPPIENQPGDDEF